MKKKILVAMSGGVDSGVAALLASESGADCIGVTMKLSGCRNGLTDSENDCCSEKDILDAKAIANSLGFPHEVYDFSDRFEEVVVRKFISCYENGKTPNPCIDCNRYLKFDSLFRHGQALGCDSIVTGHYARIERDETSGRYLLKRALDSNKDQSYVLWTLSQEQLSRAWFPLGSMTKEEARALADAHGFSNAHKQDSQDICFVPDGKYAKFVEEYTKKSYPEGDFIAPDGRIIGRHKGIIRYTVGQRRGLRLALPEPLYVRKIDPIRNEVLLGNNASLFSKSLIAKEINLIAVEKLDAPIRLKAKVRYRQNAEWATVEQLDFDTLRVTFDEPQRAITGGQSVVLYDGDTVFGGGVIE